MSNSKISALTSATTPLAGTEVLPIVQSSTTKQVSVANLTAGRTQTSNGIVQGAAATGYNFTANTPAAGMTSQLLNWYEEGTWTPTQGAGLVVVGAFTSSGRYTRIGRQVTISARLAGATSIACTAGGVFTSGLPYAPNAVAAGSATSSNIGGTILYVDATTYSVSAMAASGALYMTATYSV
jgi:hypothetical protein